MNPLPGTPPKTDPDHMLDRTLAHLANAEPAPDLNARLLRRLDAQPSTQANRKSSWGWVLFFVPTLAAAVLLALLLPRAPLLSHPPTSNIPASSNQSKLKNSQLTTEQKNHRLPHQTAPSGQEIPTPPHSKLKNSQLIAEQGIHQLPHQTVASGQGIPTPPLSKLKNSQLATEQERGLLTAQTAKYRLRGHTTTQAEAQAIDDLHAPSHPAPPLPLTAQEKAILHLLRRDGTVELAQLDPALQTKLFELQRADFKQFFDPPIPKLEGKNK